MKWLKRRYLWIVALSLASVSSVALADPPQDSQRPELSIQRGHIGAITGLNFISGGKRLISSSRDMTIKIWDVETGTEIRTLSHEHWINAIDVNRSETLVASASNDETVRIWEIASGKRLHVLPHKKDVTAVAFSQNGKLLVSGDQDGTINLWAVASGKLLASRVATPGYSINSVDFNPADSTTFVAGLHNGSMQVWRVTPKGIDLGKTISAHGKVSVVKFSDDGSLLGSSGGFVGADSHSIKLWEPGTWRQIKELKGGHTDDINALAFSTNKTTLVSGSDDKTFAIWDLHSYSRTWKSSPEVGLLALSLADNRGTLAVGGSDAFISIWDLKDKRRTTRYDVHSASATSARYFIDTGILVSVYADFTNWNTSFSVLNTFTDEPPIRLSDTSGLTSTVAVSLDGQLLASGGDGNVVTLYQLRTRKVLHVFNEPQDDIEVVAFSPDGKNLASVSENKKILVWDTQTFEQRGEFVSPFESASLLTFDANGKLLVGGLANGTMAVVGVSDGREVFRSAVTDLQSPIFNLPGTLLAGLSANKELTVQNASTGSRRKLALNVEHVINISFSETGQHLVSAEWDGSVRVWDVNSGRELFTYISLDAREWLAVTPDGFFDGTPSAWRSVLWRFGGNTFDYAPVEAFFDEFYRPGLIKEVMAGKILQVAKAGGIQARDRRLPLVKIEPVPSLAETSRTTKLKVTVRGAPAGYDTRSGSRMPAGGVRDVRLFRNGSLVKRWEGTLDKMASEPGCEKIGGTRSTSISCTATVPIIAGKNDFTAYAFNNDNVKSQDATQLIEPKGIEARLGTLYVLTIGVNKYPTRPLEYAVCDADRLGREMRDRQTRLERQQAQYAETRVVHLFNEQATRDNILLALRRLATMPPALEAHASSSPDVKVMDQLAQLKPARPEDAVVLFFSGHGLSDSDIFYLLPFDVSPAPTAAGSVAAAQWLSLIKDKAVSTQDLEQLLTTVDAGEVVMAIDACQSGQSLESEESRRGPLNSRGLAQLAYEKGMYILTASQGYEVASERSDLGHGLLTYALIEGLRAREANLNKDDIGLVTEREWMDYATRRVGELQQGEYERRGGMNEDDGCNALAKVWAKDRRGMSGSKVATDSRAGLEVRRRSKGVPGDEETGKQRPRVYYRREEPARPLIVSRVDR